jgi:putative glutamine amidotransferase
MKPRIGLTSSPSLHEDRFWEGLERTFVTAVIRAGGVPFVLPVLHPDEAPAVGAEVDGILFSGGGDLDPARYADTASPTVQGLDPERDAYEIALARTAVGRDRPVFGICRGCQLINVALGGTLVQHLPEVTDQQHCAKEQWAETVHTVRILPESRLRSVVGLDVLGVNSLHHQAVDVVGGGLRAVAWAEDGTVEAIEGVGLSRVLGVQWHPELLLADADHARLFEWLVEEAGRPAPVPEMQSAPAAAVI